MTLEPPLRYFLVLHEIVRSLSPLSSTFLSVSPSCSVQPSGPSLLPMSTSWPAQSGCRQVWWELSLLLYRHHPLWVSRSPPIACSTALPCSAWCTLCDCLQCVLPTVRLPTARSLMFVSVRQDRTLLATTLLPQPPSLFHRLRLVEVNTPTTRLNATQGCSCTHVSADGRASWSSALRRGCDVLKHDLPRTTGVTSGTASQSSTSFCAAGKIFVCFGPILEYFRLTMQRSFLELCGTSSPRPVGFGVFSACLAPSTRSKALTSGTVHFHVRTRLVVNRHRLHRSTSPRCSFFEDYLSKCS